MFSRSFLGNTLSVALKDQTWIIIIMSLLLLRLFLRVIKMILEGFGKTRTIYKVDENIIFMRHYTRMYGESRWHFKWIF